MLRALGSASCDILREASGTICYGHWVLYLMISPTRQGARFITGMGFFLRLVIPTTRQGVRFVTGIGFRIL